MMIRKKGTSLEGRLAAYGSMSLALAAVAMPAAAGAQTSLTTSAENLQIYFDPATGYAGFTGGAGDFVLVEQPPNGSTNFVFNDHLLIAPKSSLFANGNQFAASASALGGGSSAAHLTPGANIGPLLKFSSVNGTLAGSAASALGHWNSVPAMGDLGLEQTQNCAEAVCYGWANITVNSNYTITLNAFGYNSSGDAIAAGTASPEPASIILLAMGAAGIAAWRRKKATTR